MTTEIVFRLGEMLEEELKAFHGQVLSFAHAIAIANQPPPDPLGEDVTIDELTYRKLARFLKKPKDDSFKFSISELRALDRYFALQQQSLCTVPIFYRNKGILENLAESNEVTFAVATRFLTATRTETVSRWDLRAMKILFNKGAFEKTKTEVVDIFHHGSNYNEIRQEHWNQIFDERHSSIVSFGSPFTCHATERSLADIFRVKAYTADATDRDQLLPLYFVWPRSKNKGVVNNSAFLIGRRDIPKLFDKESHVVQNLTHCDRGIIVGDRWYASNRVGKSYGLFVAQRRNDTAYTSISSAPTLRTLSRLPRVWPTTTLQAVCHPMTSGMAHSRYS